MGPDPSNHKSPETLVFVCFQVSVLEEAAQKGKQGAASQGSRGVGAGSREE